MEFNCGEKNLRNIIEAVKKISEYRDEEPIVKANFTIVTVGRRSFYYFKLRVKFGNNTLGTKAK